MEENTLKQADARFEVIGIISEMNLKVDTETEGKEYIGGTIKIKTDETNTVVTDVRVNKVTKDGKENKTYDRWLTRMAEYESIADEGVDGATIVHIKKGQLRPSKYINKETGREVQGVRYSARFSGIISFNGSIELKVGTCRLRINLPVSSSLSNSSMID